MNHSMSSLLHIAASPHVDNSHSRHAANLVTQCLLEQDPKLGVILRELAINPIPHPDNCFATASLREPALRTNVDNEVLSFSETLINELETADAVLVSMPMHNFTIPSVLKAWIDHVVRPGRTFFHTPEGKQGILHNRPIRVVMACGGSLAKQEDWAIPYLRYVFGIIGLKDFGVYTLEYCHQKQTFNDDVVSDLKVWASNMLKEFYELERHILCGKMPTTMSC